MNYGNPHQQPHMTGMQVCEQALINGEAEFNKAVEELSLNINFNKEKMFAMQILEANPFLQKMPADSITKAIVNVALTGLTLHPQMKFAYLIPRKGKCVLDISYMGLCKILTDTGSVTNIHANIVYWGEEFEMERGTNPYIKHGVIDNPATPRGNIRGAYSVATLVDGSKSIEWMSSEDLVDIMNRSEAVKSGKRSPWDTDRPEMCRKTVIKRHYKYLPKTERTLMAATAIDIDHDNHGIDFKEEQSAKDKFPNSNNHQVIDVVEINEANIAKYSPIIQMINDHRVPEGVFGNMSKQDFLMQFSKEFNSGKMTVSKADSVLAKLQSFF